MSAFSPSASGQAIGPGVPLLPWDSPPPNSRLLFYTDFSNPPGLNGYVPLNDGGQPRPALSLASWPALSGMYCMAQYCGPVGNTTKDGYSMAIKRLTRPYDTNTIYGFSLAFAIGSGDTVNAPQNVEFGFDTQNLAGVRTFPKFRYATINPANGNPLNQLMVLNDAGVYVQVGTLNAPWLYNNNKFNFIYLMGEWHTENGYVSAWCSPSGLDYGAAFGNCVGQGYGHGNTSVASTFSGGINHACMMSARGAAHLTNCWMYVDHVQVWLRRGAG